jgi:hypothetical protein
MYLSLFHSNFRLSDFDEVRLRLRVALCKSVRGGHKSDQKSQENNETNN